MNEVIVNEAFIKEHRDDPTYHEVIYLHYRDLIRSIAHDYFIKDYDYEDLVSEGTVKFFHILKMWNPDLNYKFSTYLGHSLHKHYQMLLRYTGAVKRGGNVVTISIYAPVKGFDDKVQLKDVIKDPNQKQPFQTKSSDIEDFTIQYIQSIKKERDRNIVHRYLFENKTQVELSEEFGISQPQIGRVIIKHRTALNKLIEKGIY